MSLSTRGLDDPQSWLVEPEDVTPVGDDVPLLLPPHPDFGRLAAGDRPLALVIVRESCKYDRLLLEGMLGQTLALARKELPGVDVVESWGLRPLYDPESLRDEVDIVELRQGSTRAVLFCYRGVLYLYSEGSAHETDALGNNGFTLIICETIRRHRPREIWAATFTRLVRSQEQGGLLLHSCVGNVDAVRTNGLTISLVGETAEFGKQMFSFFANVSSAERTAIVQRLTCGTANKYLRGEWVQGYNSTPFAGYVYDPKTKHLRIASTEAELVSRALPVLADSTTSATRAVLELSRLGVTARGSRAGERRPLHTLKNHESAYRNLLRWAPLYATGQWGVSVVNPFPGVRHYGGLDVVLPDDAEEGDPGRLMFTYDLGLPEGGWAGTDVLSALRERYLSVHRRRSGKRAAPGLPLTGAAWTAEGYAYRILSGTRGTYVVRRLLTEEQS